MVSVVLAVVFMVLGVALVTVEVMASHTATKIKTKTGSLPGPPKPPPGPPPYLEDYDPATIIPTFRVKAAQGVVIGFPTTLSDSSVLFFPPDCSNFGP